MKKFVVKNVESCTETGDNENAGLCNFEITGPDDMEIIEVEDNQKE